MTFAELFQRWLKHTGMNQADVARGAKMSPTKINPLAKSPKANPRWTTIQKVARGFGVTTQEFLAGPKPKRGAIRAIEGIADAIEGLDDDSFERQVMEAFEILSEAIERRRDSERPRQ